MASSTDNTNFGLTIERRAPSPQPPSSRTHTPAPLTPLEAPPTLPAATSSNRSSFQTAPTNPSSQRHSYVPPNLHLSSASTAIAPALPSPYSIPESPHEKTPDLEAGTFTHQDRHIDNATAAEAATLSTTQLSAPAAIARQPSSASSTTAGAPHAPSQPRSPPSTAPASSEKGVLVESRVHECTMWPTHQDLKQKHKHAKRLRSWNPLMRLPKRTRVIVSVVIALTVIGGAVGIGVGVSRAYNGEVWAGKGKSLPVDQQ